MLSYETEKQKEGSFLALTSCTVEEFEALAASLGRTWQSRMSQQTMDGRARYERAHSDYQNCPVPRAEDKLLFILVYLKQAPTQTLQGRLFGMTQSNANKWIHLLLPTLRDTLQQVGTCPARDAVALQTLWEAAQHEQPAACEAAALRAGLAQAPVEEPAAAPPLFG